MRRTPVRKTSVAQESLAKTVMLVGLSISIWTAKKQSKVAAETAEKEFNADEGTVSSRIALIVDDALARINSIANKARAYHDKNTLPWVRRGQDMLPSLHYMEYRKGMREFQDEFDSACVDFFSAYPTLVQNMQSKIDADPKLAELISMEDYPAVAKMKSKFRFVVAIDPLPQSSDFRINLQDPDADTLLKQELSDIDKRADEAKAAATKELWKRLNDVVSKLHEALESGKTFHNTIIGNIEEVADLIPVLNIANDPDINAVNKKVEDLLCTVDPQDMRDDEAFKKEVSDDAKALLETMSAYCS